MFPHSSTSLKLSLAPDGTTQRLYYGAYQSWGAGQPQNESGVGAAQMVTHRFAALTPMNTSYPATVTLRAVDFTGVCAVTANVDTTSTSRTSNTLMSTHSGAVSTVAVELMSAGYGIDGFSKANATAIGAGVSDIAAPLSWGGAGKLPLPAALASGGVMLRAHLTGSARIYAFTLHYSECRGA